ncbi:MAG: response regulator [bacterium]
MMQKTSQKILLIEDNEFLIRDIKEHVLGNYEVYTPTKGKSFKTEALRILEEEKINLVILDLNLDSTKEDGRDVLKAIREKYPQKEELPVLVLTLLAEAAISPGGTNSVAKLANGILRKQCILETAGINEMKRVVTSMINNPLMYCPNGYAKLIDVSSEITIPPMPGDDYLVTETKKMKGLKE